MSELNRSYDIMEIMKELPHRYPFLLVDKVTEITEQGGKGYKNVTMNEEFFQGHFPGKPIMPGVLIIEGMAQCSAFIALKLLAAKEGDKNGEIKQKLIYFMMINNAKFRRPVLPGHKLEYEITVVKLSAKIGKFFGVAKVEGDIAAEAEMIAMMEGR